MKKFISLIFFLLMLLSLIGCTSRMNQIMASWEGQDANDLIANWGPPTQVMDDGSGGKILCYQQTGAIYVPRTTTGSAYSYGGATSFNTYSTPGYAFPINKYRMFWVNTNGTIYRWSWKGL
jgi:hypothetical protein